MAVYQYRYAKSARIALFLLIVSFLVPALSRAEELTSASFKVIDPVLVPLNFSSSGNFQVWGALGENALGRSSSASFQVGPGFLSYPYASTPVVSTTAGDGQVALSWSASQGYAGWTASGYSVGQATVSGGPYTYSSVGNVTSSTRTGLTNSTAYYFVVAVKDVFGNTIVTSTQVTATPVAPVTPPPSPPPASGGSGGGGSGVYIPPQTTSSVIFAGRAYPKSTVTLLKDAQIVASTVAGSDASFSITTTGVSSGNYIFSLYSEDGKGVRSSLLTFPVSVTSGATTNVNGIFIAPTISTDKSEVKKGDNIAIFGQSVPNGDVTISINSEQEYFGKAKSDAGGVYLYNFDTTPLEVGQHVTKSKAASNGEITSFSNVVGFAVGSKTVLAAPVKKCPAKADLNGDCKVNLVDFSIAAYWYKRTLTPDFKAKETAQLNGDSKVNLVDFSIMAFYWTG